VADARLPARVGALLASPRRALGEQDREGGGALDAFLVGVICAVCVRLAEIERAFIGWEAAPVAAIRQVLMLVARELQWPLVLAVAAGVAVTIAAGRRRDPGRDAELGAAALIPFFAVRSVMATVELVAGKVFPKLDEAATGLALAWALFLVLLAVQVARGRVTPPEAEPGETARGPLAPRIAVTAFAAVLGVALIANVTAFARSGRNAPAFTLPRVDRPGATLALADLRGQVVLLDFWATWCQPCTQMAKPLAELYTEFHPRGVEFVGINSDGPGITADEVVAHLQRHPAPYPIVLDDDGRVGTEYNVPALPHMVVLGRDGSVRKVFTGITTRNELSRALSRAGQ
jgi:peroxiredoxin